MLCNFVLELGLQCKLPSFGVLHTLWGMNAFYSLVSWLPLLRRASGIIMQYGIKEVVKG